MGKTGNQRYNYGPPDPFVTPTIEEQRPLFEDLGALGGFFAAFSPSDIFQHDQLIYSGPIIENIMFHISLEYEFRGQGRQQWKAYKTGPDDFDTFVAGGSRNQSAAFAGAVTLEQYPVKWFPLYVKDMQEKIEALVNDGGFPDSLPSLMARIFLVNVSNGRAWDEKQSLPRSLIVPASEENNDGPQSTETLSPLSNISTGWAIDPQGPHVQSVVPRMGIDFKGQAYVTRSDLGVTTGDTPDKSSFEGNANLQWPRSVIGQRRTQQDYRIVDGFVEKKDGASIDGIDGIHMPGIQSDQIDSGRPIQHRKIANEDAVLPGAVGKPDMQSGYGWFAHHPHVLQQLRYQPPMVETWEGQTEIRDYVENLFGRLTPNLPWYFSQPVEKVHFSDWGGWLIQGLGGLNNGMELTAYPDPQYDTVITNCPFSVFYPPSSSNCSCGASNTAYGIWSSSTEAMIWNQRPIFNDLTNSGAFKVFGPRTRLILDASFTLGAGTGAGGGAGWWLGIRTTRIGGASLQPFVAVMGAGTGATDVNAFSAGKDVNLMDAMQFHYPAYTKAGVDAILAIGIFVSTTTGASAVVDAEDGPGGSFIPSTDLGCAIGTSVARCNKLYLFEPPYEGFGDPRDPPRLEHGTVISPPAYNLPNSEG